MISQASRRRELPFTRASSTEKRRMEPTNPNANTHAKTNGQTLFDTLVGRSCKTLLWKPVLGTLARHSCHGTILWRTLWDTLVGHSCRKLWRDTIAGHSCGARHSHIRRTLLWGNLVGLVCGTILWDILRATLYSSVFRDTLTLLLETFVGHQPLVG